MVNNMEESISFYENLLDYETHLKINNGEKEICFLSHDGLPQFEIELIRDLHPSTSYSEHGLVNHLAFVVEDIEKAVSHFKQAGVTFVTKEPKNGIYGRKGIRFKGPSGEILQFVQDQVNKKVWSFKDFPQTINFLVARIICAN